jgi:hypothetical protein
MDRRAILFAALLALPQVVLADTVVTYTLGDGNVRNLGAGGTVVFTPTAVGSSSTATLTVASTSSQGTTISVVAVNGDNFHLIALPLLPVTVQGTQVLRFGVAYVPTATGSSAGSLQVTTSDGTFTFALQGTTASPDFALSYFLADGNFLPLVSGTTITVPSVIVGNTATIGISVRNRAGSGTLSSVGIAGNASFALAGLPPLPVVINASEEVRFGITYSPTEIENATATLTIVLGDQTVVATVQASAIGPVFSYNLVAGGAVSPLQPGGVIALPDTAVGKTSTVTVQVQNTGSAKGQLAALAISGDGFRITDAPFLPLVLAPGALTTVDIQFAPTHPGPAKGRLRVGSDDFAIAGTALGAQLVYTFTANDTTATVDAAHPVVFSPLAIGGNSAVAFSIQNTGNVATLVSSIFLTDSNAGFSLENLPAFPLRFGPGESKSFLIRFTPKGAGPASTSLRIDSDSLTLVGSAAGATPLPEILFTGASGTQPPGQQPAIGLSLASPYSMPLTGVLTLNVQSDSFAVDPAVQFASGGRTVSFSIPANTTDAVFANGAKQIRLQTGTVAGVIVVTPSFSAPGGVNVTPDSVASLTLTVPQSAPQLLEIQILSTSANSITVSVSGYSTSRSLKQLDFDFTPAANFTLASTHFSVNIESASSTWFRGTGSQSFGGLFSATIAFGLQSSGSQTNLVSAVRSISVTASSELGKSNAVSVELP